MRKSYKNLLIIASAAAITCTSTFASARCADLRGTWQNYGYVTSNGTPTESYACTFSTATDGTLEAGSVCKTYSLYDGLETSPGNGYGATGQYIAEDDANGLCRISGTLNIGAVPLTIVDALMNRAGDMIQGLEIFGTYGAGVKPLTLYRVD